MRLRDTLAELGTSQNPVGQNVCDFILYDEICPVCPDKDKAGKRFRLGDLTQLHLRFIEESDCDISYSQFTRYIPDYVIKPRPQDWRISLCKTCLNPEFLEKMFCVTPYQDREPV